MPCFIILFLTLIAIVVDIEAGDKPGGWAVYRSWAPAVVFTGWLLAILSLPVSFAVGSLP